MLSYALAIAVALSSLALFFTAFLMSDIHRRDDFLWSGVGLFYALVLWFCARNITGAVLLGQAAATVLLVSYSWQTLKLRKAVANPTRAAEINNFSVLRTVNNLVKRKKPQAVKVEPVTVPPLDKVTETKITMPDQASPQSGQSNFSQSTVSKKSKSGGKSGVLGKIFGNKQKATITNTKLDDILEPESKKESKPESKPESKTESANIASPVKVQANVPAANTAASETIVNQKKAVSEVLDTMQLKDAAQTKVNPTPESQAIAAKTQPMEQPETSSQPDNQAKAVQATPSPNVQDTSSTDIPDNIAAPVDNQVSASEPETKQAATAPEQQTKNNPDFSSGDRSSVPEVNSSEVSPSATEEVAPEIQPEQKSSSLDALEMVEVAEVLDARSEDSSIDRESDQSNIIEVTTTEINITTEVMKIEPESDADANSESKNAPG